MSGRGSWLGYFGGRVVAVTGAGAGIGRELAVQLARAGARLALADLEASAVKDTLDLFGTVSGSVFAAAVDVSDRDAVLEHASDVGDKFGRVDAVFNNAGILFAGDVVDSEFATDRGRRPVAVDLAVGRCGRRASRRRTLRGAGLQDSRLSVAERVGSSTNSRNSRPPDRRFSMR
ncbi:SDR family NAD(P)-dependent oxidoreductase [Rhodococcus sp. JVH1]|uniref:SDR family NAD(P)-dependent oxidoreductase n=1 Tax=Rhodococcus sp. JVH1 TaxID=745408 RepID=UPI000A017DDA